MTAVATEHVLVVPTALFHEIGYFQGFCTDTERYLSRLFQPEHMSYRPRGDMEKDASFKQLIPYVLFRHTSPSGEVTLFQYTRGKGQGESRLHSKKSVGIGGHISSDDAAASSVYEEGMRRELEEEVRIETPYKIQLAGILNDDLTEVGKVHLGIVHIFDVESQQVHPREAEICDAGFRPLSELFGELDRFESWSKIALESLFNQ
jgi:predicted NUDIX family phosphoesterase